MSDEKVFSIVFILDESGSMESMGNEPWQSINNFVEDQKKIRNFKFTLLFFNNKSRFIFKNLESDNIPILTEKDYNPSNMTALNDALGSSIMYQKSQTLENVIFVILTDGLENSSKEFSRTQIKQMIEEMENIHKWKFIYLAANQDACLVGNNMGISTSKTFDCTPTGLCNIMRTVSSSVSRAISGETNIKDFNLDAVNINKV
jgi:hypothetical protein